MKPTDDTPITKPLEMESLAMPEGLESGPISGRMGKSAIDAFYGDTSVTMRLSTMATKAGQNGASALPSSLWEALIHPLADGYTVQFPGTKPGRTKTFRGVEYGSMKLARAAAVNWRNEQAATLSSLLEFPTGERIYWSDRELDDVTERAALLEGSVRAGMSPDKGYQLLHYVRMAIVQVLPWSRWRRIGQVRAIPYDIAARYPAKRRRVDAFLAELKAEEAELSRLSTPMVDAMPKELNGKHAAKPTTGPADGAAVVRTVLSATKPSDALMKAAGENLAPVIAGFVRVTVGEMVSPLVKLVDESIKENREAVEGGLASLKESACELGKVIDKLREVPAFPTGPSVSSEALETHRRTMEEIKEMQELITEELSRVSSIAAEIEEGKENVDTRLADLERAVFRLQSAAAHGSASPMAVGPRIEPPEEPVRIQRRAVVPVIAIMGPLPAQFRQVEQRVGDAAELHHVENKGPGASIVVPDRCEWGINNRFGNHTQEAALMQALGRDRVIYVGTGGISSMVRAVADIVERVNREGAK